MRILFIAPIPPPIHGQSLASQVFLREIEKYHEVALVNTAKKKEGGVTGVLKRFLKVGALLLWTVASVRKAEVVYLTISESLAGNLKDLFTYMLCLGKLDRTYIHLHGGAGMIRIMKGRNAFLAFVNRLFIRRLRGVIILGESHRPVFEGAIPGRRLHVVPNFAEDYLFIDQDRLPVKFASGGAIRLLYLSNLIPGKGYMELLEAYLSLPAGARPGIQVDFAGAFQSEQGKSEFLVRIEGQSGIRYHGVVRGEEKRKLFHEAHVFCLPTYYPFEGQPISILEAYAAGCAVVSTDHSGIRDVFEDGVNGYQVEKRSPEAIRRVLERLLAHPQELLPFSSKNRIMAETRYRTSIYNGSLKRIMGI